jgi:GTP-binding protein EngB required for normal cell division
MFSATLATGEGWMNPETPNASNPLNEYQKRKLHVTCEYIDKQLLEVESVLNQASSKAAFPRYRSEITPAQRRTIENYIARIRAQLLRVIAGQDIHPRAPSIPARRAIHVALTFIEISAEELYPKSMQGYGTVSDSAAADLNGIAGELLALATTLDRYVLDGVGDDLRQRLLHLEKTEDELQLLRTVEQVVSERGMVEFRSAIGDILDRAEDKSFEIAIFGRVSSGKSSLLNAILETEVLPVGVTPVTAVPTRIVHGLNSLMTVWFSDHPVQELELGRLSEFVSEQSNPGNAKHVSRVVLQLPATRIQNGVTFVDTPGLGSLATRGASETLAYLPKCDLGVVLIDAGSTLTPDDLQTILALTEATIPLMVLLSKADLLSDHDIDHVIAYIKEHIKTECNLDISVHPVSALPSHRSLLDRWFENDILPLYSICQELRSASLKRKIGALRESVAASLRVRLREPGDEPAFSTEQMRDVETRLRIATGKIEALVNGTESELERIFADVRGPIEKASVEVIAFWSNDHVSDISAEVVVRRAIAGAIQERVHLWKERVSSLARELSTDLRFSASELGIPDMPTEEEFLSLVRNLPVFDASIATFQAARPTAALLFGKRFAQDQIARTLEGQIKTQLSTAVETYTGLLRKWTEDVLNQFRECFQTYADRYRAQAENVLGKPTLSVDDAVLIRHNLLLLDAKDSAAQSVVR